MYGYFEALDTSWPAYGQMKTFLNVTTDGFVVAPTDEDQLRRCEVVNKVLADPANGI